MSAFRRTRRLAAVPLLAAAIAAAPAAATTSAPDLAANPGLESPADGSGVTAYLTGNDLGGWTVLGPRGVDHVGNGLWTPSEGGLTVDLNESDRGGLQQTLTGAVPGSAYQVHYALAGNFYGPPAKKTGVLRFGSLSKAFSFDTTGASAATMDWQCPTVAVTAPGTGPATLSLTSTTNNPGQNWYGPVVDDIRVVPGDALTVTKAAHPTIGIGAKNFSLVVSGTNFTPGATVSMTYPGLTVGATTYVKPTQLKVKVTVASSAVTGQSLDLTVNDAAGAFDTCGRSMSISARPVVSGVSPSSASPGQSGVPVVVSGSGFEKTPALSFGAGVTVDSRTYVSPSEVDAVVSVAPGAATGPRTVKVTNPDGGTSTAAGAFSVVASF